MRGRGRALLVAASLASLGAPAAPAQEAVIDVRAARPPAGNSFEALYTAYRRAEAAGDAENTRRILDEIRRLRIERNIRSLEGLGLVFVGRGLDVLNKGDRTRAEEEFRTAAALDPHLPDAYFGMSLADLKRGPLGVFAAVKDVASGVTARLPTSRGRFYLLTLLVAVCLVGLLAAITVFALALVLRYGTLLLHDLEEAMPGRPRTFAMGVYVLLLLLPLVTFQGYGWLPLWWMALLFAYAANVERVLCLLGLVVAVAAGPALASLGARIEAQRNPLFRAGMLAVEAAADQRAVEDVERAVKETPDDKDLVYLQGILYKKAGQYDAAAAVYRDLMKASEKDAVALNDLGNIEFARQEYPAAITRYKQAAAAGNSPLVTATAFYNLSLAHLQKFERQEADEARGQADRLAGSLLRDYEALWKYETRNESAVVDLGLSADEVYAKFEGVRTGVGRKNVMGRSLPSIDSALLLRGVLNRFLGFVLVFGACVLAIGRWRGARAFTMRCMKCGAPFCKRCHLGAASSGLCTQCFHLFMVRDGVSGPARNQKLLEVQREDERRERLFRALSLVSPGAGHLYAQKTLLGMLFGLVWYLLLSAALLAGRLLPVTEAPAPLAGRWGLILAALLLLATYVVANRARPDFEVVLLAPPPRSPRRPRPA